MTALSPADLARELGVTQKRVRDALRDVYGDLPFGKELAAADESTADAVRKLLGSHNDRPLADLAVPDLLGQYAEILTELRARRIIRTANAPLGDYVEYLALQVYGGQLAANSAKSYDILTGDSRRIQVKARTLFPATSRSSAFSAFRSFDFDVASFVVLDGATYELLWARELGPTEVHDAARWSPRVNAHIIRMPLVQRLGVDVTDSYASVLASSVAAHTKGFSSTPPVAEGPGCIP